MANWNDGRNQRTGFGNMAGMPGADARGNATGIVHDEGLRSHMLSIYNYMASGVLLTGVIALLFAQSGLAAQVLNGGLLTWVIMLSPLAFVLAMSFGANKFSAATLQAMFWGYSAVMGLSLSSIFLVYTGESIALTFFATAGAFAGLSLFGYTTKKDLSGLGTFLIMGVVGLIIASLLNAFLIGSPGLELAISALGVLIFAGLTAYDTQRLKTEYSYVRGTPVEKKSVIMGALSLYLDFINMFLFLLRFMGNRE
ncbi:MAG: Bax inhibitor-1/YccA family protein [Pontixanthobacter sp.]